MIRWARKSEEDSDLFRVYRKRFPHHYRKWEYPWCFYHANVKNGMRLLDAGGGDSLFLENYIGMGCDCISTMDPEYGAVPVSKHPGIQIVAERMEEMSFADNSFDRIFCQGVMEHVNYSDRISAAKQLARVLKPGGMLLITFDYYYPGHLLPEMSSYIRTTFFRIDDDTCANVKGREILDQLQELELWQPAFREPIPGDKDFSENLLFRNPDIMGCMVPLEEGTLGLTFIGIILYKPYQFEKLLKLVPILNPVHKNQRISKIPLMRYIDGSRNVEAIVEMAELDAARNPILKSRLPQKKKGYAAIFNGLFKNGTLNLVRES